MKHENISVKLRPKCMAVARNQLSILKQVRSCVRVPVEVVVACLSILAITAQTAATFATTNNNDVKSNNASQIVRDLVSNEIKAQQSDQSLWQYRETKQQSGKTELIEIVETKHGDLQRVVAVNGNPLMPQEVQKEDARIQHLVSSSQTLRNQRQVEEQDSAKERNLLGMLPDAFRFQDAGSEGALIKFDFTPNLAYHPRSREAQVFHYMEGTIWFDPTEKRLARISGRLTSEVKFGGGILGHLAKGGTFVVEQEEVGRGNWELKRLDVDMNGTVLFFKTVSVIQKVLNSDFKPVPSNTTLRQAAEMLERESPASAINRDAGSGEGPRGLRNE